MEDKNGRQAFPRRPYITGDVGCEEWTGGQKGMTLLDYFAGQALIGIISHPQWPAGEWEKSAIQAYLAAQSMLEEKRRLENP